MFIERRKLFIGLALLLQFPIHACRTALSNAANNAPLPWGEGKVLLFKDMQAYCELNDIKPEITYAAMHYGKAQRGNSKTIAAVKKKMSAIMTRIKRIDEIMEDLDFESTAYKKRYEELKKLSGEHQLQGESLEMMDWASAWKLAYNKKDVIDSYAPEERYPVDIPGRPYPPL